MSTITKGRSVKPAKAKAVRTKSRAKTSVSGKPERTVKKGTKYTVSDGTLDLVLEWDGAKWYVVTCPAIPDLLTQARTIDEAFYMAYDAKRTLDAFASGDTE